MKTFYRTTFILAMLIATMTAGARDLAVRNPGLWLNQIPAVIDTTAERIYFTLPKDAPNEIQGTLSWDHTMYQSVAVNGKELTATPLNLEIDDWTLHGKHKMTLRNADGQTSEWTLLFTNLPIISIEQNQKVLYERDKRLGGKGPYYYGSATFIDANGRTRYKDNDEEGILDQPIYAFSTPIKIKVRGATSKSHVKKPFNIKLIDTDDMDLNVHIFGYRKDNSWMVDPAAYDYGRFRNRLLTDLWNSVEDLPYEKDNDYQGNGSCGEFVEMFMEGKYWGIYAFMDKIDRKKLNLKKTAEADLEQPERVRGMLWKTVLQAGECSLADYDQDPRPNSLNWALDYKDRACIEQKYPDDRPDQGDFRPICNMIDNATGNSVSDKQFMDSLENYVYVDQWIDYICLTQAFQIKDNMYKNYYLSIRNIEKGKVFNFTPWDLDVSLGRTTGAEEQTSDKKLWAFGEKLAQGNNIVYRLSKAKKITKWRRQLYDRWCELYFGEWSLENVQKRVEEFTHLFYRSGAWDREFERWSPELNYDVITEIKEDGVVIGYDTICKRRIGPDILAEGDFVMNFLQMNYKVFNEKMVEFGFPNPETLAQETGVVRDGNDNDVMIDGDDIFVTVAPGSYCRLYTLSGHLIDEKRSDNHGNAIFHMSGKPHGVYCVAGGNTRRKVAY